MKTFKHSKNKKYNKLFLRNKNYNLGEFELPADFLTRMKSILGSEYDAFVSALNEKKQTAIFVNNKIETNYFKQIIDFSIEQVPYETKGFYVDEKLGRHPLHHAGAFYIQEPSAMFTVNAHKFIGNEQVLDMCASPGGKSIQIANRLPNGVLVSNEINSERCNVLFSNIERMGLKNVIISNDTPSNIASAYANCFDVVLVDAPCSGEGMFRRGEQVVNEWNCNLPQMCAERQRDILECANKALKQHGFLIYSTCTYSQEENELMIKNFLSVHNYKLINIDADLPRGIDLTETVRLYPHKVKGEGQFVAVLQKLEENDNCGAPNLRLKNSSFAEQFFKTVTGSSAECFEYGDYSYVTPNKAMLKKGVNYYSVGVRIGNAKDGRFEPAHNVFTSFGKDFIEYLNYDYKDETVTRYLKGETLNVDLPDGYGAFLVSGCAVGGFKISAGKFKNYYPKGLRNNNWPLNRNKIFKKIIFGRIFA